MGFRNSPHGFQMWFVLFTVLAAPSYLFPRNGVEGNKTGPERFYIVSQRFSDGGPHWFDYIFDVRQDGNDVLIRAIRIAPENAVCDQVEVKALERRVADTSVGQVAGGVDLCSIQESDADRAIANAKGKRPASVTESEQLGIVAQCHGSQRLFLLPYPEMLDMAALKHDTPIVAALYGLEWVIYKRAFGNKDVFYNITPAEDADLQRLGASLLAELQAGTYDLGFGDESSRKLCRGVSPCALGLTRDLLEFYENPAHKPHVPIVTLIEPEQSGLAKYVAPEFPQLAKMARIQGNVDVEISVDPATGTVKQVHAISGHPLLQKSAENAIKDWVFHGADGSLTKPVSAVLSFSLGREDAPSKLHSP